MTSLSFVGFTEPESSLSTGAVQQELALPRSWLSTVKKGGKPLLGTWRALGPSGGVEVSQCLVHK